MARRVVRPKGSRNPAQLLDKGGRKARDAESSQTLFQMRKTWQRVKKSRERQERQGETETCPSGTSCLSSPQDSDGSNLAPWWHVRLLLRCARPFCAQS